MPRSHSEHKSHKVKLKQLLFILKHMNGASPVGNECWCFAERGEGGKFRHRVGGGRDEVKRGEFMRCARKIVRLCE